MKSEPLSKYTILDKAGNLKAPAVIEKEINAMLTDPGNRLSQIPAFIEGSKQLAALARGATTREELDKLAESIASAIASGRKFEQFIYNRIPRITDAARVFAKVVTSILRPKHAELKDAVSTTLEGARKVVREKIKKLDREANAQRAADLERQAQEAGNLSASQENIAATANHPQTRANAQETAAAAGQAQIDLTSQATAVKAAPVPATAAPIQTGQGRVVEQVVREYQIVDINLLPREYLVPNETLIRQAVNAGTINIPGVQIWESTKAVVKK